MLQHPATGTRLPHYRSRCNDSFLNKYLSRVEGDSDFAGIAEEIYNAFKLGRAAIVAKDYTTRNVQADSNKHR